MELTRKPEPAGRPWGAAPRPRTEEEEWRTSQGAKIPLKPPQLRDRIAQIPSDPDPVLRFFDHLNAERKEMYGEIAKLPTIAQHISQTERRAMLAERETSDRLLAQFLATKIGAEFMGRVSGVTRSGLFVRLLETGADGFIPASTIGIPVTPRCHARRFARLRSQRWFAKRGSSGWSVVAGKWNSR